MEIHSRAELDQMLQAEETLLTYFYATWCRFCRVQTPILNLAEQEMSRQMTVARIDIDQNKDLKAAYEVTGTPTFILFQKGKEVTRHSGILIKEDLAKLIEKA